MKCKMCPEGKIIIFGRRYNIPRKNMFRALREFRTMCLSDALEKMKTLNAKYYPLLQKQLLPQFCFILQPQSYMTSNFAALMNQI